MKRSSKLVPSVALMVLAFPWAWGCSQEDPPAESETPQTEGESEADPSPAGEDEAPAQAASGDVDLGDAVGTYEIDSGHSTAVFRINRFGIANFYGAFHDITGTITLAEEPSESVVNIEIDPASVFTASRDRDEHLKNPDFFNVNEHPVMRFSSSEVEVLGDNRFRVDGELEIRGRTESTSAEVELIGAGETPMDDFRAGFEATLTIDRHDFNVSFMEGALSDEVELIIAVETVRT